MRFLIRSQFIGTQAMIIGFYLAVIALVGLGTLGVWTLAVLFSLPRAYQVLKIFGKPRPSSPPEGYPVWPLWYVAAAFSLTRHTGALFAMGLLVNALVPVSLSL